LITLALAIGGTTAIVSVVHAVLLRPLPYRDSQRLISSFEDLGNLGGFPPGGQFPSIRSGIDLLVSEIDLHTAKTGIELTCEIAANNRQSPAHPICRRNWCPSRAD